MSEALLSALYFTMELSKGGPNLKSLGISQQTAAFAIRSDCAEIVRGLLLGQAGGLALRLHQVTALLDAVANGRWRDAYAAVSAISSTLCETDTHEPLH